MSTITNMHRTGTQVDGVVHAPDIQGVAVASSQACRRHDPEFRHERRICRALALGQEVHLQARYSGSVYQDAQQFLHGRKSILRPVRALANARAMADRPAHFGLMSLWPEQPGQRLQLDAWRGSAGEEPIRGHHQLHHDAAESTPFMPFISPVDFHQCGQIRPCCADALPASSLNGAINTLLTNNVLDDPDYARTEIEAELPLLRLRQSIRRSFVPRLDVTDVKVRIRPPRLTHRCSSLSVSYTKQNAGADLNWRPIAQWNFGAAYGHERYNWTRADVDVTNENSGKVFADWKPRVGSRRAQAGLLPDRRYGNYDYQIRRQYHGTSNDADWSCSTQYSMRCGSSIWTTATGKGQVLGAIDVLRGLTVTPTFGFQDDNYHRARRKPDLRLATAARGTPALK